MAGAALSPYFSVHATWMESIGCRFGFQALHLTSDVAFSVSSLNLLDGFNIHDDWAAQRAPFFSMEVAKMIVPYMKELNDQPHVCR